MDQKIKRLEIQIEGVRLERDRLTKAYFSGELLKSPFRQTHALNSQIFKLSSELTELRLSDPLKYDTAAPRTPNPVELIATWCSIFNFMLVVTWLCGGISACIQGENVWLAIVSVGIFVFLIGLPGLFAQNLLESVQARMWDILPTYRCSASLFHGGIKQYWRTIQRCWRSYSVGAYLTTFIGIWIVIGDLTCLFNPEAFTLSIVGVLCFSFGGFIVIVARLAFDIARGRRKARQVL